VGNVPLLRTLTGCSKDGTVRQHDLRTHHVCGEGSCPPPLVKLNHELSSISSSPLKPYQFVVAGESPYVRRASLPPVRVNLYYKGLSV
jgi:hypothetical protein